MVNLDITFMTNIFQCKYVPNVAWNKLIRKNYHLPEIFDTHSILYFVQLLHGSDEETEPTEGGTDLSHMACWRHSQE